MKLTDVVLRRTGLGTHAYPGQAALRICASIMSRELGWSELRLNEEISAVDGVYGLYGLYGCGCQAADG
jgi:glycerol-3-phosphate dehydrogenase